MNTGIAKQLDSQALEDLGRATLGIVHDLKNQLNGLKLYATYLRKRLETEDRSPEERETIAKLVAGLDRAARDMTTLVTYARPLELRQQPHTDLRAVIKMAMNNPAYRMSGPLNENFAENVGAEPLIGAFDPHVLAEALSALTREALGGVRPTERLNLSLEVRRVNEDDSLRAIVEWRGLSARPNGVELGVHGAFGRRVVEAHGGVVEFDPEMLRANLPLSE